MDENIYISLIYKRFDGTLSPEEEKRLHDWLAASEEHRLEAKAVEQALLLGAKYSSEVDVDLDADFELLQKRIASDAPDTQRIARDATAQVVPELKMDTKPSGKIRPLFKAWQVAASVALLLLAGFLVKQYLGESPQWQEQFASTKQDKAILLADGTKVWLNAGTTFRYPKSFDGNTRSVQLSGEAFFQVAKDATKPFIIKSTSGTVQVLGTSFNVRDFDKEELMSVDVVEGKVKVAVAQTKEEVILVKNEQATYHKKSKQLKKQKTTNQAAWHTRSLRFDNIALDLAIRQIEKEYGISIQIQNPKLAACPLSSEFKKSNVKAILDNLSLLYQATWKKQTDGKYILLGGGCDY